MKFLKILDRRSLQPKYNSNSNINSNLGTSSFVKSQSKKKEINSSLKTAKNLYIKNPYAAEYSSNSRKLESFSTTNKANNSNNFLFSNEFNMHYNMK